MSSRTFIAMSILGHEHLAHDSYGLDFFQHRYTPEFSAQQDPCGVLASLNYGVNGLADPTSAPNYAHSQPLFFTPENALGLSKMDQINTTWFSFSRPQLGHEPSAVDTAMDYWPTPSQNRPIDSDLAMLTSTEGSFPHILTQPATPRDTFSEEGSCLGDLAVSSLPMNTHIEESQTLSPSGRRPRWPYDAARPTHRNCAPLSSPRWAGLHECQWLDNGGACGATVMGTKQDIVTHLYSAHSIHPRGNKSRQVCLWKDCRSVLNKESMARHILSVHLKEKVRCPSCHLSFARSDSVQRHRKTCRAGRRLKPIRGMDSTPSLTV